MFIDKFVTLKLFKVVGVLADVILDSSNPKSTIVLQRILTCEGSDQERLLSEAVRKLEDPQVKWVSLRKS